MRARLEQIDSCRHNVVNNNNPADWIVYSPKMRMLLGYLEVLNSYQMNYFSFSNTERMAEVNNGQANAHLNQPPASPSKPESLQQCLLTSIQLKDEQIKRSTPYLYLSTSLQETQVGVPASAKSSSSSYTAKMTELILQILF